MTSVVEFQYWVIMHTKLGSFCPKVTSFDGFFCIFGNGGMHIAHQLAYVLETPDLIHKHKPTSLDSSM